MAYKPSARRQITKDTTVTWESADGETVECWVRYRPALVTGYLFDEMREQKTVVDQTAVWLSKVVSEWDVLDENGERIPPAFDEIRGYEFGFLNAVMAGIQAAMRPNPESGETS